MRTPPRPALWPTGIPDRRLRPIPFATYTFQRRPPTGNYTAASIYLSLHLQLTSLGEVKNNEQASISDSGKIQITVNVGRAYRRKTSFAAWGMFINSATECDRTTW